jgi:hypothetical protein
LLDQPSDNFANNAGREAFEAVVNVDVAALRQSECAFEELIGGPPGGSWWIQFYHPITRKLERYSLSTVDECAANLTLRRVNLEVALRRPDIASVVLPAPVLECLGGVAPPLAVAQPPVTLGEPVKIAAETPILQVLADYVQQATPTTS